MTTRPDIIESAVISFQYRSKEKAVKCNNLIENIFEVQLLPEIGNATDSLVPAFATVEIEKLEINLGQIQEEDLSQNLGQKIRSALRDALEGSIKDSFPFLNAEKYASNTVEELGILEALAYYLQKGFLPHWLDKGISLNMLMDKAFGFNRTHLNQMIRGISRNQEVKKRIAFGLEPTYFDKLIEVLEPMQAEWIFEYREDLIPVLQRDRVFTSKPDGIERSINYFILQFIIDESGSQFNRERFSESVLRQASSHHNLDFELFIEKMAFTISLMEQETVTFKDLKDVLTSIQKRNKRVGDKTNISGQFTKSHEVKNGVSTIKKDKANDLQALLLYFLKGIFPRGSNEELSPVQIIESLSPVDLQNFFQRLGTITGPPEVNQRIAIDLPSKYFDDLLKTLEPGQGGWILTFRKLLIPHLIKEEKRSIGQAETEKSANLFLLKLISSKRDSVFNKENFSKNLLRDIAAHYHIDLHSLVESLISLNMDQLPDKSQNLVLLKETLASLRREAFNAPDETLIEKELKKGARISEMNQNQIGDPETLLLYFSKGSSPDDPGKASSVWHLLKSLSPSDQEYFFKRLSKIAGSPEINQRIALDLPRKYFNRLLKILDPQEAIWIQTFRSLIEAFFIKTGEFDPYKEADEHAINLMIVTFLCDKPGHNFDRKVFSERVIKEIVTGHDIQIKPILDQLNDLLANGKTNDPDLLLLRDTLTSQLRKSRDFFKGAKPINNFGNDTGRDFNGTGQDSIQTFNEPKYARILADSISTKRKIIRYFLISGSLPRNNLSLGVHDIRVIFLELLKTGDPALAGLIREGSNRYGYLSRIKQLLDKKNMGVFVQYANRQFDAAVDWFFQHVETGLAIPDDAIKPACFFDYFLPALIIGKGDRKSPPFAFYKALYNLGKFKKYLFPEQQVFHQLPNRLDILQYFSFLNSFAPLQGSRKGRLLYDLFWIKRLRPFGINLVSHHTTDKRKLRLSSYIPQTDRATTATFLLHLKSKKTLEKLYPSENAIARDYTFFKSQITESQKSILRELTQYIHLKERGTTINIDKIRSHVKNLIDLHSIESEFLLKLIQSDGKTGFGVIQLMKNFMSPVEWKIFSKSLPAYLFSPKTWRVLHSPMDNPHLISPPFDERPAKDQPEIATKGKSLKNGGSFRNHKLSLTIVENPLKELFSDAGRTLKDPTTILLFWLDKGYLPWWSKRKTVLEILDDLSDAKLPIDKKEENELALLLADSAFLNRLLSEFHPSQLDGIYKNLAIRWAFRSVQKHYKKVKEIRRHLEKPDTGEVGEKHIHKMRLDIYSSSRFRKTEKELWMQAYTKDPNLLEKTVYHNHDRFLVEKFFHDGGKIKAQIEVLLSLTGYMYLGNLNGNKWRNMVFEFSLNYYGAGARFSDKFYLDFLAYIRKKHAAHNWDAILGLVYQKSLTQKNQITFPKDFDTVLGLSRVHSQTDLPEKSVQVGDQARIGNAGLVLTGPFLTALFMKLGFLEDGRFISDESQSRAAYILQHLAFNHISFAEYDLVLNKILTGIPAHVHLKPITEVSDSEKDLLESLLKGMLSNWSKLNNSSPAALQEAFLQRSGILTFEETSVNLKVESKGLDVLLDSVSWNFKLIKLPWMEKSLQVEWR